MKQAIMDKLVGLPMEREDDMVGFVGWLNTFVDRSLTERGLPALTGPPRANDRQQAGMGSVYESHRKVMDDVVDDSGLRRPIRRGEGGGGAVAVGGTGRSEPLRDMSQRNHDETDLKAASSSGRAGTLTKKDTEVSLEGEESAPFVCVVECCYLWSSRPQSSWSIERVDGIIQSAGLLERPSIVV
jgi:hypothetical protein